MYVFKWCHCCNNNLGAKGDTRDPEIPGDHGIRGPRGLIGKVTLHGYAMLTTVRYHLHHQTL